MEIGPHVFQKSGRQTHTDRQTDAATLYLDVPLYAPMVIADTRYNAIQRGSC